MPAHEAGAAAPLGVMRSQTQKCVALPLLLLLLDAWVASAERHHGAGPFVGLQCSLTSNFGFDKLCAGYSSHFACVNLRVG